MASANFVSLLNPQKIIWGGGVFGPAGIFIDDIYKRSLQMGATAQYQTGGICSLSIVR